MLKGRIALSSYARALACVIGLVACVPRNLPALPPAPWPEPVASYTIDVRYDGDTHTVTGTETLHWRNRTQHAATELQFHVYLNAFANNHSTFMRELGGDWIDWVEEYDDPWGYTEIMSIRIGGIELVERARFISPDDGNVDDRTVLALELPEPVAAGGAVDVEIKFNSKLPRALARTGHAGPYAFVAQWFPKLGVFEESGRWNCHQYHHTTEFYADFGTYDVTLVVPGDSVVGATGELLEDTRETDDTRRLRFRAEGVHDFAWAVDPRFEVVERRINGVLARLLIQPEHRAQADRYLGALHAAMTHYERWVDAYPYPTITLIDPGAGGDGTGGMEYPTLITVGTTWWMPAGLRVPEIITVHEFGHQYWYGIAANNEFEHAWLDEGINSYLEGRIMDAAYGAASYIDLFGLRADSIDDWRFAYLRAPDLDPVARPAWQFIDRESYASVTYTKTALALDTLDRYYGKGGVRRALAAFFEKARFGHPAPHEFFAALEQQMGVDLDWYIDQVFHGTGVADYAVTRVESDRSDDLRGYPVADARAGEVVLGEEDAEERPSAYRNQIVVERLGEVIFPVRIDVQFDDGTSASEEWDGVARWKRLDYTGTQRVDWVVVDPEGTLTLDVNRLNNSRMREAGTRGLVRLTTRWGFWFQSLLHVLTGL